MFDTFIIIWTYIKKRQISSCTPKRETLFEINCGIGFKILPGDNSDYFYQVILIFFFRVGGGYTAHSDDNSVIETF